MSESAKLPVTVAIALLGYLITYTINLRLARRSDNLARINRQLAELYGPLFALEAASAIAWNAFRKKYRPGQSFFVNGKGPTEDELKAWRRWMTYVFMPINRRMYECVISKADLLIESQMPKCLVDLCAHVAAYEVVLKKWEEDDFTEHTSLLNFPTQDLTKYISESFKNLKTEQKKLLREANG